MRRGFTLIELLVVISIIALLIAILLPALSRARTSAKLIQDLSNVRQWAIASNAYAVDNKDLLPQGDIGQAHVQTWVWIRLKTWETLNEDYGLPEEASQCISYEDSDSKPFFQPQPGWAQWGTVGWIYYGNRNDVSLGTTQDGENYVTPKRPGDPNATSQTLLTCWHYDGETIGRPFGSWVPHINEGLDGSQYASGSLGGDITTSGFSGLNVARTDCSASWVPYRDLEWFEQAEALYFQPD